MPTKKSKYEKDVFYFFTITCYNWLSLFEITDCYNKIYEWFNILKSYGIKTVSYVIMPNHLHAIIFYPEKINLKLRKVDNKENHKEKSVNQLIGTGKRFLAYEIVKRLEGNKERNILRLMSNGISEREKKKGKLHQVFQPSFDLKMIETEKYLLQKINYIHKNPVAKKWNLVEDYRKYKYSSAGFYELENCSGYEVEHYLLVL